MTGQVVGRVRGRVNGGPRPSIELWHFLEHQAVRSRATWTSTIVSSLLYPVMFLVAIGFGLGSQIDDTTSLGTDDYVSFVGPGVVAAAAMMQATGLSLWPTLGAVKWEGTYQAVLATPLASRELATGHLLWIGFRAFVSSSLYLVVLTLFGIPGSWWTLMVPLICIATALAFAAPISAWSATRESDMSFGIILRLLITPMFLFSGAFFPVDQLPDSIEWFSRAIPVWHGVELSRGLVGGTVEFGPAIGHLGYLLLWCLIGWVAAVRAFESRLAS